ncbi:MAG: methylenetetrahydrofolate reductase [bacterium]
MLIPSLYKKGTMPVSLEIFPPKGELKTSDLAAMLSALSDLHPAFISVTCSAGGTGGNSAKTARLAGIVERTYRVPAAAHLTCINATRAEIDATLTAIRWEGIQNILALRGDRVAGCTPTDFQYGADLIRYLRAKPECDSMAIGAGCYPEGHVECDSPERDLEHLKEKQDAGADFLLSQLFFENASFYRFIDGARARGITLPVEAGIMPIMSKSQITRMIFLCGASLPAPVVRLLARYEDDPDSLLEAAMDYSAAQIEELIHSGAPDGIHLYSMNKPGVARALTEAARNAGS